MTAILANHGHDVDRRVLLAERDAARRDRIVAALRADLAKMERKLLESELEAAEYLRQIERLEQQIGVLFASSSWRWTAPVRRVTGLVGRLRVSLGGKPPAVLPGPPPPKDTVEVQPAALSLREQAILNRLQPAG